MNEYIDDVWEVEFQRGEKNQTVWRGKDIIACGPVDWIVQDTNGSNFKFNNLCKTVDPSAIIGVSRYFDNMRQYGHCKRDQSAVGWSTLDPTSRFSCNCWPNDLSEQPAFWHFKSRISKTLLFSDRLCSLAKSLTQEALITPTLVSSS